MAEPDSAELRKEILKSFHTQFAENQRSNQQLFLKIVGFLGAVVLGFVYVYENHGYDPAKLSYATIVSEILLSFGAGAVTIISYSFRRDQYVNAMIRTECGVLGEVAGKQIFPTSYNPCISVNKKNFISWMPDILALFYLVFPIFQIIILYLFTEKLSIKLRYENCDRFLTVIMALTVTAIGSSISLPICYFQKLKRFCRFNRKTTKDKKVSGLGREKSAK